MLRPCSREQGRQKVFSTSMQDVIINRFGPNELIKVSDRPDLSIVHFRTGHPQLAPWLCSWPLDGSSRSPSSFVLGPDDSPETARPNLCITLEETDAAPASALPRGKVVLGRDNIQGGAA